MGKEQEQLVDGGSSIHDEDGRDDNTTNNNDEDIMMNDNDDDDDKGSCSSSRMSSSNGGWLWTSCKLAVSLTLLALTVSDLVTASSSDQQQQQRRRLVEETKTTLDTPPSYMEPLFEDLKERKKLMEDTPPEEVKYWFEYAGPLQKYYYRWSKSRGKADSFEGRDDSGVVSARFVEQPGGGPYFEELPHDALYHNCQQMGHTGDKSEMCRILVTLNMVGAGRGATMLWETAPPRDVYPKPWISEQETAATHLERQLREFNHMCATHQMKVRVQVLVCEPIPGQWTDWMDSLLPACGGQPLSTDPVDPTNVEVEERPSPVQVVVVASAQSSDQCHDLKSGFMEKRMQDLILAPPYLTSDEVVEDPTIKTTHPDLISSDDFDLYIALKWSSLVTTRAVSSFLQASLDLVHAANTPVDQEEDATTVALNGPSSPFLIPSFLRVSYVSEENNKVAKWRMHGDFFHPAAWEISKDSFDMTWIPDQTLPNQGQWWMYMAEEQMPTNPEIHANRVTPPLVQGGSNFVWMLTEQQRQELVKLHHCQHLNQANKSNNCGELPQAVLPLGDLQSFCINFTPNTALGKKHLQGHAPGYSRAEEMKLDRDMVRERKQLKGQEDIEKALFDYTVYASALIHKDATLKAARSRDAILTKKPDPQILGPQTVKSSYYDVTITKPRDPTLAWCQHMARHGLCSLYATYFRTSQDTRCHEACGLQKDWTPIPPKE